MPSPKNHLSFLDALRGFAALGVILVHSALVSEQSGDLLFVGFAGQRGVQLFYVISAFTLCLSHDVRRTEAHPLGNYFIRRFFRIAPLFYVAVLGNFLINGFGPRPEAVDGLTGWQILGGLFFLNGLHPYTLNSIAMGGWSIAVETSFYLVLPLVLFYVTTVKRSIWLLIVGMFLATAIGMICLQHSTTPQWRGYFLTGWFPVEFPVFCMGICAYQLCRVYGSGWVRPKLASFGFMLLAAAIFFSSIPATAYVLYWPCFAFMPLIFGLYIHEWKVVVNPVTVFLGKISYSIYLTHFFVLLVVQYAWDQRLYLFRSHPAASFASLVMVFFAILLPSVAISTVTYLVIEAPGMRLGKYLIQRREKAPVAVRL